MEAGSRAMEANNGAIKTYPGVWRLTLELWRTTLSLEAHSKAQRIILDPWRLAMEWCKLT
jgi:hypothetical protein